MCLGSNGIKKWKEGVENELTKLGAINGVIGSFGGVVDSTVTQKLKKALAICNIYIMKFFSFCYRMIFFL